MIVVVQPEFFICSSVSLACSGQKQSQGGGDKQHSSVLPGQLKEPFLKEQSFAGDNCSVLKYL